MNIKQEMDILEKQLSSVEKRLTAVRRATGGGGESNTASNVGTAGVGPFNSKVGVDLQFRKINAASDKVIVALDAPNKEVDIDVDPSKIDIGDLGDVNPAAPNDNDVLTWDDGTSKWAPVAGGGAGGAENPWAHRRSGRCYTTWDFYTAAIFAITRNWLYAYPFIVPVAQTFDRILVAVSTAQVNGVCRIGIYGDSGVYPSSLILDSGEIDCSGVPGYKSVVIDEELSAGLYWLVINHDGDANVTFRAMDYNITYPMSWFAILGKADNNWVTPPHTHWKVAEVYGALPNPFTGGAAMQNAENLVAIHLRKA